MDATMIDVTTINNPKAGEEVTILGRQGSEEITAMMIADWTTTVCYDIISQWSKRIKKIIV